MNHSLENRIKVFVHAQQARKRWVALLLCLSIMVSLGTVSVLTRRGEALTYQKRVLACTYAPTEGEGYAPYVAHVHNDDCYDENHNLVCPLSEIEAHYHTDACFQMVTELVCGKEENTGHVHTEDCYALSDEFICGQEESEGHVHTDDCWLWEESLVCVLEEDEEHTHDGSCYTLEPTALICGLEESEGHIHTDACHARSDELICGLEEGEGAHTHDESCYDEHQVAVCGLQGLHIHRADCYDEEGNLTCGQQQLEVHVHGEECFQTVEEMEEDEEVFDVTDEDYTWIAAGDPNADIENENIWKQMFDELELTGEWRKDLLTVAETQLGYGESTANYAVTERGAIKGYTRYGAWHGIPYGDWCAMFASFCIRWAGIPETYMPIDCNCSNWVKALNQDGLFGWAESYAPKAGDLVFYDFNEDGIADHVGIVESVDTERGLLVSIEGNRTKYVERFEINMAEGRILGYGILPEGLPASEETEMPAQHFEDSTDELDVLVEAPEGAFPAGTEMRVSAVDPAEIMDAVTESVREDVVSVQAVDISFFDADGNEIEPLKPVRVVMTPKEQPETAEQTVVHIPTKGEAAVVEHTEDSEAGELAFEAEAFSVYAIVYTVDFSYSFNGQVYEFSLPGGDKIALSELAEVLGLLHGTSFASGSEFASQVENVTFSDPKLLAVTKVTDDTTYARIDTEVFDVFVAGGESVEDETAVTAPDWILTSLAPFRTEETLAVTMKNGDQFTIDVTDDQVSNLADFVTDATLEIEGKTYGAGSTWNVREGVDYALTLTFKEAGSRQFPAGGSEIVMEPKDLGGMSLEPGQSGSFDIPMGLYGTVTGNTWWVDSDGKLHIRFGSDPDDLLTRSNNAYFNLEFGVKFSGSGDTVEFNDRVTRPWTADTSSDISVKKSGHYNASTGKMEYTVTVTSTGNSTNVKVTDNFVNTNLLTLDQSSITITPNKELASSGNITSASGFTRVISSMSHGETVTITYTADVNESALGAGGIVTGDDGKNNVKVETDQGKEDEKTSIVNEIKWSDLSKVSTASEEASDDKIKLSWEINANTAKTASLVGSTISDKIDWNSKEMMKYVQSDGKVSLTVVGTDASGKTYTKTIQIPVGNNQNQESWSWVVENIGEPAGTPLSYKITYDTIATKQTENSSVKNDANNNAGGSDSGVGVVPGTTPGGGGSGGDEHKIVTKKETTEVTAEYIDWNIVINVPAEGFPDGLTVTDYLPREQGSYDGANGFADRLVGEPVISGHDYYTWNVTDDYSMHFTRDGENYATQTLTIEFYQDSAKTQKGVGTGAKTITISLRTANDQKWLEYAATRGGGDPAYYHKNTGKVNNTDINAYGIPLKPAIEKALRSTSKKDDLPVYEYMITLSNVTELPIVIEDSFDTDFLEFYRVGIDSWNALDYIAAAEQKHQLNGGTNGYAATVTTTDEGIVITANDLPKKQDGSFYEYYRIYYSLKVKDADALAALDAQALANGGKYTLHNAAVWNGLTGEADVDYEVSIIDKDGYFASNNANERKFTFVIDANPNRYKLGTDGTVELIDQHTDNLTVDYSSVKIYKIPTGTSVGNAKSASQNGTLQDAWLCDGNTVPWNFNGNEGTFYLQDETHYVIVYDAVVIGSGKQEFSNIADLNGHISSKSGDKTYSNDQSSGGDVYEIKLLKYKNGMTSNALQGATFQMFRGTGEYYQVSDDKGNTWWEEEKEPMKYGDTVYTRGERAYTVAGVTKFDTNGENIVGENITFTTGNDGLVDIALDYTVHGNSIEPDVHYYLKEIDSPSGYQIDSSTEYWAFTLTTDPDEVNYGDGARRDEYGNRQWVYFYYNDILKVNNTETKEPLDVVVNKTWYDENGNEITGENLNEDFVATIQLYRKTDNGDYEPVKVDETALQTAKANGTEIPVNAITVASGNEGVVSLTKDNNWAYTWSKLPRVELSGTGGSATIVHRFAYRVEEVNVDGYVVSETESETETVKTYALKNYKVPENPPVYKDITVIKSWQDAEGNNIEGTAEKLPENIQFRLYQVPSTTPFTKAPTSGGKPYVITDDARLVNKNAADDDGDYGVYKITKTDNWTTTFRDLPTLIVTENTDGTKNVMYYAYYVKEVTTGYTTTYTSSEDGTTRTIINREPLSPDNEYINIGLEKKWTDGANTTPPAGASATFTVHQQKSTKSGVEGTISVSGGGESITANPGDTVTLSLSGNAYGGTSLWVNGSIVSYYVGLDSNGKGSYQYSIPSDFNGTELSFSMGDNSVEITSITDGSGGNVFYSDYEDTTWTREVTLPTTAGNWSTTIQNLISVDADGNKYRYYITEDSCTPTASNVTFVDGTGVDIKDSSATGNQTTAALTKTGQKIVVTNTYEKENVSFSFGKIWLGSNGNISTKGDYQEWQKEITVTIKRKAGAEEDQDFELKYTLTAGTGEFTPLTDSKRPDAEGSTNTLKLTASDTGNVFNFALPEKSLAKTNSGGTAWTYYVVESDVIDYVTHYGTVSEGVGFIISGAKDANDGGLIINQTFGGYELPSTGGPGTKFFTTLGGLICLVGVSMLLMRKRRIS